MKCPVCDKKLKEHLGSHHYLESGLDNVYLEKAPIRDCSDCGYSEVGIPAVMALHEIICKHLVTTPMRLTGKEVRFIRTNLKMSAVQFAKAMDVHKVTVSRWENDKSPLNKSSAYLLKLMVYSHFTKEKKRILEMIEDVSLSEEEARRQVEKSLNAGKHKKTRITFPIPNSTVKLALEVA